MIRFAELLAARYGTDPEVTWLLDHHEVHLVPVMNPDGRKQAETGDALARKNRNDDFCSGSSTRGIDLNRNFDFMWGNAVCNGSSPSACSLSFHGPAAGSEPETQAIQIRPGRSIVTSLSPETPACRERGPEPRLEQRPRTFPPDVPGARGGEA